MGELGAGTGRRRIQVIQERGRGKGEKMTRRPKDPVNLRNEVCHRDDLSRKSSCQLSSPIEPK